MTFTILIIYSQGNGIHYWKDGNRYEGNFVNDSAEGSGTLYFNPNTKFVKYVGDFKDWKFNGRGTYFWKNGDRYEGSFRY